MSAGKVALQITAALVWWVTPMAGPQSAWGQDDAQFPVNTTILVDGKFERCEGIAFNGKVISTSRETAGSGA